eukprot:Lithocolla_globosa_v1_NODE_6454_length_1086_cov_2.369544.p1 type:complete len:152 gc:universal NODE_6454_length_1086_cov_2.369544:528-73(-)
MHVWGKAGECDPSHIVLPITVEHTKPRMCWNGQFINLWTASPPFKLETLHTIPRWADKWASTIDLKNGYYQVHIVKEAQTYFGLKWQGVYYVYTCLPFGWNRSAYIFQTITVAATAYVRHLGVPAQMYIDDAIIGNIGYKNKKNKKNKISE